MTDISTSEVELLRARLKAIVLALSTKEQKELLRMIKEGRAAKAENCTAKTECSNGRENERYQRQSAQAGAFS